MSQFLIELLPARKVQLVLSQSSIGNQSSVSLVYSSQDSHETIWSKKQKRQYGRFLSGLKRYWDKFLGHPMHLTLTSMDIESGNRLGLDWSHFVNWARKQFGRFEFCKITTKEGYGVIHALVYSPKLLSLMKLDFYGCLEYLRANWAYFHGGSFKISITECYGSVRSVANYLVGRYLASSHHFNSYMGYSRNWIFKGWVKVFKYFIQKLGFQEGISPQVLYIFPIY